MARERIPVVGHLGLVPRHVTWSGYREYIADVHAGRFPERGHLVEMEAPFLDEVVRAIGGAPANHQD